MSPNLPERPHLDYLKKEAKDLLRAAERGEEPAVARLRALGKHEAPRLADAQLAVARGYGFASWRQLKGHVEAVRARREPADGMIELAAAVKANDPAGVRGVIERRPEVRTRLDEALPGGDFGATALLTAVHRGNREIVDLLLDAGASINQRSHWWAGGFGILDHEGQLVDHLLSRGARVDAYAAARHGWRDRLAALLADDPAAARMCGGDGQTPLHVAASVEIADLLLEHGAEIDALDVDHESTPAQYLVRDRPEVTRQLVARGAKPDLLMAVALGDVDLVRRLLDEDPSRIGMSVTEAWFPKRNPHSGGTIYNWTLERHHSAHYIARKFGHEEVFALLMERSPASLRLAAAGEIGDETLLATLRAEHPGLIEELHPADRRRLVDAAQDADLPAVRAMLAAGWPADSLGQHGATALHWAAFHGQAEMVREILRHKPPLELRDDDFRSTPLGWALHGSKHSWHCKDGDYGGTVRALVAAGAQVPAPATGVDASPEALAALK